MRPVKIDTRSEKTASCWVHITYRHPTPAGRPHRALLANDSRPKGAVGAQLHADPRATELGQDRILRDCAACRWPTCPTEPNGGASLAMEIREYCILLGAREYVTAAEKMAAGIGVKALDVGHRNSRLGVRGARRDEHQCGDEQTQSCHEGIG